MDNELPPLWKDLWSKHLHRPVAVVLFNLTKDAHLTCVPWCVNTEHSDHLSRWLKLSVVRVGRRSSAVNRSDGVKTMIVSPINGCRGDRKCHRIPPPSQGPGKLSPHEKRVVTVIYGCSNPLSESPDIYPPRVSFSSKILDQEYLKPEKRLASGKEEKSERKKKGRLYRSILFPV